MKLQRLIGNRLVNSILCWLLCTVLLFAVSGCTQQMKTGTADEDSQPVQVVQELPFDQRWADIWSSQDGLATLLGRVRGKQLELTVKAAISHNQQPKSALRNLRRAISITKQTRVQVHAELKYRKSGGISLQTSWERELWKAIDGQLANPDVAAGLTELDLLAARQSMAAQVVKGWFYALAIRQHRTGAEERLQIYQQMRSRAETGFTLGRAEQQEVDVAQHQELAARYQLEKIEAAENFAEKALNALTGLDPSERLKAAGKSRVLQLASGIQLEQLTQRPDVHAAETKLLSVFNTEVDAKLIQMPDLQVTAKYGRPAKQFRNLLGKKTGLLDAGYPLLTVAPGTEIQRQALTDYDAALWQSMKELRSLLQRGRSLQNQYAERKTKHKQVVADLNDARARYNAGRTNLSGVLATQLPVLDADGAMGYVQYGMYGQRMDNYLAAGVFME